MSVNLTAYSQVTGIQIETKKEIVKTLQLYPKVVEENQTLIELNEAFKSTITTLEKTIKNRDIIIDIQEKEIENLLKQKKKYKEEVDRERSYGFIYFQTNLNGFNSYGVGIDYTFKGRIIIGGNINYNDFYNETNINIKAGFKIF